MHQFVDLPFGRIGTFPLCVGVGLMMLVLDILFRGRREGLSQAQLNDKLLPALPFCLLFGAIFAGFTDTLFHDGVGIAFRHPFSRGVNYFGWLCGCMIFLIVFAVIARLSVRTLLEIFVPSCLPAQAIGRVGCFLGGCCYGVPSVPRWGVVFPKGSLPYEMYGSVPLVPVQLYEAGWLLVVYVVVMTCVRRGSRAGVSLMAMGAGRAAFEFWRGDCRGLLWGCSGLSPAQGFSIALFCSGVLLLRVPCCRGKWSV